MNWTLDQLEAFVTSVKQGSFSSAARKLGKAQSRVSTAIANLEADLGFELFDRSARLPVLTAEGEEMFIEAQAVLSQCQRLQSRAMTVGRGEELSLTVAMDEAVPIAAFEELFQQLGVKYPTLRLTIINGSQDDIANWVEEKKADIGILFHSQALSDVLEFSPIGQFRHSLIVSSRHPLASHPAPSLSELNQYRQLVIRDRVGHSQAEAFSALHWYVDSYYYISALVARGIGWALIPEHIASAEWHSNDLRVLSTEHIPHSLLVEMGIVTRRDRGDGPITKWMYSTVMKMLAD